MNIYKVSRKEGYGYDRYDSFVCYAKNKESAEKMLPEPIHPNDPEDTAECELLINLVWTTDPANIYSEYLGECQDIEEGGVILASFNSAG